MRNQDTNGKGDDNIAHHSTQVVRETDVNNDNVR